MVSASVEAGRLYKDLQEAYVQAMGAVEAGDYGGAVNEYLEVCTIASDIEVKDESFYDTEKFIAYRSRFLDAVLRDVVDEEKGIHSEILDGILQGYLNNIPQRRRMTMSEQGQCEQEETRYFLDAVIKKAGKNVEGFFAAHQRRLQQLIGFVNFRVYAKARDLEDVLAADA